MNKFWNFIRDDLTGERELRLDAPISDVTWYGDEITPQQFREELNSCEGDITVWINSPGGDVFAATEIYNMLKSYRGKVTVKIDALAGSAASIVAMAGEVVEISPSGQIFLHDPETEAIGNIEEFNAVIQMLAEVKEGIINVYADKTNLPREQISQLMTAATWLNAQKAVELKFADKILFREGQNDSTLPAQSFSERAIANSIAKAFRAKNKLTRVKNNKNRRRRLELLTTALGRKKS